MVQWALRHVEEGTKRAGKWNARPDLYLYTQVYVSRDVEKARDMCKGAVAAAYNIFAAEPNLRLEELPRKFASRVLRMRGEMAYDFKDHLHVKAPHTKALTDEDIDLWSIVGPPDAVVDRFDRIRNLGIGNFIVPVLWEEREKKKFLSTFSESIMSYFRDLQSDAS